MSSEKNTPRQDGLYERARAVFAGGVSAGGRYNNSLRAPLYLAEATGPWLESVDGRRYLDFHNAAGAAFFGFRHPRHRQAIERGMERGFFINFDTEHHVELAELLCRSIPCAEAVRLSNTGTESTMAALRLARAFTGKEKVLKFEGHFHGMHELIWYNHSALGERSSSGQIASVHDSAGMPEAFGRLVINVEFNDAEAFMRAVERHRDELAAVIMEPVSFNCGCMPARREFLQTVREVCTREGIVLIFDEVLSGFRMALGGAQEHFGVTPDLCTLAKALGGGFPISAVAGKREIMDLLNPTGPVVMSGTYTGSLVPVLGALECVKMMREPDFYTRIGRHADLLYSGISELFKKHGVKGHVRGIGARFGLFFGIEDPEADYRFRSITKGFDAATHKRFTALAVDHGLYFLDTGYTMAPTHFGFTSAHTTEDLETALDKLDGVFSELSR